MITDFTKTVLKRFCCVGAAVLFLWSLPCVEAAASVQARQISISMSGVTLDDVLIHLQDRYGYYILYNSNTARNVKGLSINFNNATLEQIMRAALNGTDLEYTLNDNTVVIKQRQAAAQQPGGTTENIRVTGVVRSTAGTPIPGVTIVVKGTQRGTASDANGRFTISVTRMPGAVVTLSFTAIGYSSAEAEVSDNKPLNVEMREIAYQIDPAVVINTGVFSKAKEAWVGEATRITKTELEANHTRGLLETVAFMEPSLRLRENNAQGSNPNYIPEITIRGKTSFSDFTDLQGKTQSSANQPLVVLDGFEITLDKFMDMNIDEIEEITILKDAAATALYGSRGANGVIVVTSAKPKPGTMKVTYTGQMRIEIPELRSYNLLNAEQKLAVEMLADIYSGTNYTQTLMEVSEAIRNGVDTDWLKVATRTGYGMSHRAQITGGEETLRFMGNIAYEERIGVIKGSFRKIFNGGLVVTYEKNKLYVSNNLSINRTNGEESAYGNFSAIALLNPYWEPKDPQGKWYDSWSHPAAFSPVKNPAYNSSTTFFDKTSTTGITNNLSVRYQLFEDLRATARLGLSRTINDNDKFIPASHTNYLTSVRPAEEKGDYTQGRRLADRWEVSLTLDYSKVIREKSSLNIGVNSQLRSSHGTTSMGTAIGFYNDHLNQLGNAIKWSPYERPVGFETDTRSVEVMATANYMYDMRYAVDLMYRADGNSSFGDQSRWNTHFSMGGTWVINREEFFDLDFVDMFRVKYSYGMSGAENHVSPQQALYVFNYDMKELYGSFLASYLAEYGNPNLGWQNTYQHNVGLEMSLFNNRLGVNASYYNKHTTNSTMPLELTPSHGYPSYVDNIGEQSNTGWELGFNVNIVRNADWNVVLWTRMSSNKNKIVKLSDEMKRLVQIEIEDNQSTMQYWYTYREGASMSALFVYHSVGIDPLSGKRLYVMPNGMYTPYTHNLKGDSKIYVGDTEDTVNGSASASIRYRGLTVNLNFSYHWGGVEMNQTILNKVENAHWSNNVDRRVYTDRWRKPGDMALYKGLRQNRSPSFPNNQFVEKDNAIILSGLNIMYDFPKEWLKRNLKLESLQVNAQLSDIWRTATIWRERGTEYPYSINPNFSVRITF